MLVSDFAIRKPIATITVMLALVVFGLLALWRLKTDEFPDIQQPIVVVGIPYPGASPETVEREVVDPIEDAIFSIAGLDPKKTTATAIDGFAQLIVFFDFEKDPQQMTQDVRDAISAKRQDLPTEMEEPVITRFDPADMPIVTLTLTGALPVPALTRIADELVKRDLRAAPGVADVRIVGGQVRELTVELRPEALAAAGVSAGEVAAALQAQNLAAPVGRVNGPLTERSIRLLGRLATPEEFAQITVATRNGQAVRLGQLATARDGSEEQRTLALFDGHEAVGIEVLKTKGYSTTAVADDVKARARALSARLPAGARLEVVQDAGERVRRSVDEVETTLVEGALLTVLVVFLFLNSWRSTVITGLALPVSVLAAFVSVWVFGFTLNTMSLLGLSLAIGILIDDAIVVRENIVRHVELGEDHTTASFKGTDEIGVAVAATTFSIVAVFVPIGFMYGVAGQWFKPFALTIAAAVLVSLFVSFSLDPMLSAYWPDPQVEQGRRTGRVARTLGAFNRWFDRQADRYEGVVAWALDHRLAMFLLASGSFVGAIVLQAVLGGGGFVPISDRSEVNLTVQAPPGSSLEYTRRKVDEAVAVARRHPEVRYAYASIGTPLMGQVPGVDQANVYLRLVPKSARALSQDRLGRLLRDELGRVAGAEISVFTSGFGGAYKQIQMELRGPDSRVLAELAERIRLIAKAVPGASDVGLSTRGQKPELEVRVDRGLAGNLGVTVGNVAQSLRVAFAGLHAGDWVDPTGETRKVMVRLAPEARSRAADLRQLPLVAPGGGGPPRVIPLGQVAAVREGVGPVQISHLDRQRFIAIQGNAAGRPLSDVVGDIQARVGREVKLPAGYTLRQGGESADFAEVVLRIVTALLVAVLLMYLILVLQFGSFLDPLAIMLSLPLSLIGVILLFGIVAKNAILLIDFAKWAQQQRGIPIRDALVEAGRIRLRPIVMTSVAIVAGMIPVALGLGEGGDFRAPLGRAVIGGVVTSTILTLLVIPTVYETMYGMRVWARARLARLFRAGAAHGGGEAVAARRAPRD